MLVLSRKVGQEITIGNSQEIKVTLIKSRDGIARIGIEAPRSIPVVRSELLDRDPAGDRVKSDKQNDEAAA